MKNNKPANNNCVTIDDGTREVSLVNKYGKLICKVHFRPTDFSIIDRYNAMMLGLDAMVEPLKNMSLRNDGTATFEEDWATLKRVENDLKDKINELFDMDDADDLFAKRSPFASVGGTFYFFHVLRGLQKYIEEAVEEEMQRSQERVSAYLGDLESAPTEEMSDAGGTTD